MPQASPNRKQRGGERHRRANARDPGHKADGAEDNHSASNGRGGEDRSHRYTCRATAPLRAVERVRRSSRTRIKMAYQEAKSKPDSTDSERSGLGSDHLTSLLSDRDRDASVCVVTESGSAAAAGR